MIKPTIGRVVLYYPPGAYSVKSQPRPALICCVHNDRLINIGGFDCNGVPFQATSVVMLQDDEPRPDYGHAEWMPYQKAVASGQTPPTLHVVKEEPKDGHCGLCGLPMLPGETMFTYHGYSENCEDAKKRLAK